MKFFFKQLPKTAKKKKSSIIEKTDQQPRLIKPLIEPETHKLLVCVLLSLIIAVIIAPQLTVPKYSYKPGDISQHTIRAPRDFSVEDLEATEKRRLETVNTVLSVYDFNARAEEKIERRINTAFAYMRSELLTGQKPSGDSADRKAEFEKRLKINVTDKDFTILVKRRFKKEIEDYLLDLTVPFGRKEIVASKEQLFKERGRGIVLRDIYSEEDIVVEDFSSFIDLKEAHILIKRDAQKMLSNVRSDVRRAILHLATKLIDPTITFNQIETKSRREISLNDISPLYYNLKKGEIIIREGARVTDATLVKLKALTQLKQQRNILGTLTGYFCFSLLSLLILYRFATSSLTTGAGTKITQRDLLFLCATFVLTLLLIKFFIVSAKVLSKGYATIPMDAYLYAIPFTFAAIVISVVLTPRVSSLCSIIISVFACFLLDSRFTFFVYSFISALIAAQEVSHCKERKTIIRAGLTVGGVNALLILSLSLIQGELFKPETAIATGLGVLGGILSAVLATGFIPIIEMTFNYTTDIKLLELADLNQPVLRRLLITAPGTYHHSILVGIMAEAAAEGITANPLLARVSAYYHDIGKIKKPLYFVENQKVGENKHDKLLPSMSSLIITAHVKDGMEIAKQHRLGQPIMDIIAQHHGTSIISYFYQKAKEQGEKLKEPVSDKDFRYPGPRPQTKEAGIVMLADAVQATSKTLTDPTPARIQSMVQRIINNIFVDGQLDECELTLKDLHLIAGNFIRILNGIFHSRIEYPDKAEKETNGKDMDKKPAKPDQDRPARPETDGERDLGTRIGISKSRSKHSAAG